MSALQSWRKAYGALKDSTTVSLANLNSDFKVRRRILLPPPLVTRSDYGGVRCPRCIGTCGFLWFLMIFFAGSRCGDREGHQPRGEPAQGALPAQCVDSSFILASDFFLGLNLAGDEMRGLAGSSSAVVSPLISRFAFGV